MEKDKMIYLTDVDIDKFRALSKSEKTTLVSNIKVDSMIINFEYLHHNAKVKGYTVECTKGHNFTEWRPIEYKNMDKYYHTPHFEQVYLHGAPVEDKMARVCQRCGYLDLLDVNIKKLIKK